MKIMVLALSLMVLAAGYVGVVVGKRSVECDDGGKNDYMRGFIDGIDAQPLEKPELLTGGKDYFILSVFNVADDATLNYIDPYRTKISTGEELEFQGFLVYESGDDTEEPAP